MSQLADINKSTTNKRYFIIDQKVRHFVHNSEYQIPLHFYETQTINHFLNSRISSNHDKGLGF